MAPSASKNCIVRSFPLDLADKLREVLEAKDWEFTSAEYCVFKASKNKTSLALYTSGKLVVQGKEASDLVEFVIEPEVMKERAFENASPDTEEFDGNFTPHAGTDESGKGDFFGPMVTACVFVPDKGAVSELRLLGVCDSKLIKSDDEIARIARGIKAVKGVKYSVVAIGPEAYNGAYERIGNLNRLLAWSHARAIDKVLTQESSCTSVLADKFGNESLIKNALSPEAKKRITLTQMVRGERDAAVAAASIIARDEFVRRMKRLGDELTHCTLPKGAGSNVDVVAKKIAVLGGRELLSKVAKMHFRNAYKALGLPMPEKVPFRHY